MSLTIDQLLTTAKDETIAISKLKMAKYNPRKKLKAGDPEYEHIKTSILTYGMVGDVIVNADYTIINGHQRVQICKDLGLKEVPCKVLNLDKDMERAANLAFNKAQGEWDFDAVALSLNELVQNDISTEITGFSDEEVEALLATLDGGAVDMDADAEKEGKGDGKDTKLKTIYLAIGKDRIPISGEEKDAMINLIEEYVDANDSPVGFVTWLVGQVGHRP